MSISPFIFNRTYAFADSVTYDIYRKKYNHYSFSIVKEVIKNIKRKND